jgi:hypothetical protein
MPEEVQVSLTSMGSDDIYTDDVSDQQLLDHTLLLDLKGLVSLWQFRFGSLSLTPQSRV